MKMVYLSSIQLDNTTRLSERHLRYSTKNYYSIYSAKK